MNELGTSAYSMNTNGDRNFVIEAYKRHVEAWETTAFSLTVVESETKNDET